MSIYNERQLKRVAQQAFNEGVEAGIKYMMDKLEKNFEIGRPILINDKLYWLRDIKQNLLDIMDDIENTWNEEHGEES